MFIPHGQVTLSLDDYHRLLEEARVHERRIQQVEAAAEQLQILLNFLARQAAEPVKKEVYDAIQAFNEQSEVARIRLHQGQYLIELL